MRMLKMAVASALLLMGTPMTASALTKQEINQKINEFQVKLKEDITQQKALERARARGGASWNDDRAALLDRVLERIAAWRDLIQKYKDKPVSA